MDFFRFPLLLVAIFFEINYRCIRAQRCQGRTFDITEKSLTSFCYNQTKSALSEFECVKHCKKDRKCDQAYYWAGKRQCFLTGANSERVHQLSGDEVLMKIKLTETDCDPRASIKSKDCSELFKKGTKQNGEYTVKPRDGGESIKVYCDMTTDGGGWTVFQTRKDGSEDFYRGWNDYKNGFGNLTDEFWLGNDNVNRLTNKDTYLLRVDMEDWSGDKRYAVYDTFSLASEGDNYRLSVGTYSGDAGDSLIAHHGCQFSTKDDDNDSWSGGSCADKAKGAWWYTSCTQSNLNGLYHNGTHDIEAEGVNWFLFKGYNYSLKRTSMKFRPVGFE